MQADILVVDDEPEIADLVEVYLQSEGFTVHKCGTGAAALALVGERPLDLAILDVMLPDLDGLTICAEIRKDYHFPILMLTAKGEDLDKITGLTIGADDYLTKPFNPLELVARVKAQLRRYTRYNESERGAGDVIDFNGLVINRSSHECWLYDKPLVLTPIEFDILWLLCENRGQVISAEQLFETVWREKYLDRNNTVMVHIRRLREKMGEPSRNPRFIKTVWGVGYKID
ncbi:VanR-ABDEGLN family DNA-binding response regulator [Pseudoflavonifractor sp. 524-17]|uniref:VanR-ABDEGLN family response regulator transcription factor n=1 Tax=Pseudoflavonifractor sp. 524-17 TaxID=2304577 RepID=UPI0013797E84|nr:VanR-ABDEGLN family response regulator transcription factor [Pseudoflavonifractor sp. 524-17]NCE63156.1 VanR-ABDEGLN family DNA-binding response regulator [Pseudoflavonifractor sp. 524-17]